MAGRAGRWVVTAAVLCTLVTGCKSDDSGTKAAPAPSPSMTPAAPSLSPSPSPSPSQSPVPAKLRRGDEGPGVTAAQKRLTDLGYWHGRADGKFGATMQQAVYALQKAAGLGRDGVIGPKTAKALEDGVRPAAKSKSGHVIEIDKKRQLLMIVEDGEVGTILNTSTGSGRRYETDGGGTAVAKTPVGKFAVYRQIDGWRDAPLGLLWRPKYFNGGIAVHGANSIPPYAASHGCARLSIAAMNWIWQHDKMPGGTKVWVY
jgi:peptidoglycan hydrolase-like protein with peptidoglycan-binding domain